MEQEDIMNALILLCAMITPTIESSERGTVVTVEAPETGYYSGCWMTGNLGTFREPEEVRPNCWLFPFEAPSRGIITLVHCTDDGCELIDIEFGEPLIDRGLLLALAAALGAGLLMNFMPCVLPVLGLKLRAYAEPRKRWAYVAGVLASFMVLATLSLALGTGLSLMGFGHYRMALSVVCFLFGFALLGAWHIPTFGVSGKLGPFGMGILTVALGSSCAVPFLAPAMAYCATCSVFETYLIFGALGGGFCSPFMLPIGGFIGYFRHYLPHIERGCAILLLGVSVWIFSTLHSDLQLPCTLLCGGSLIVLMSATRRAEISNRKFWVAVIGVSTSILVAGAVLLASVDTNVSVVPQEVPELNEPQCTFVTASWCANCAAMKMVMQDDRVVARLAELGIVPVILDYTDRPPEIRKFLDASYSTDVPIVRIVGVTGNVTILRGVWTVTAVLDALKEPDATIMTDVGTMPLRPAHSARPL